MINKPQVLSHFMGFIDNQKLKQAIEPNDEKDMITLVVKN